MKGINLYSNPLSPAQEDGFSLFIWRACFWRTFENQHPRSLWNIKMLFIFLIKHLYVLYFKLLYFYSIYHTIYINFSLNYKKNNCNIIEKRLFSHFLYSFTKSLVEYFSDASALIFEWSSNVTFSVLNLVEDLSLVTLLLPN